MSQQPDWGVASAADLIGKDGLTIIQQIMSGDLPAPPMAKTLSLRITKAEIGKVTFTGTPKFDYYNPAGTIHGGWTATLLDSALGCAVQTTLSAGEIYTTVDFSMSLTRAIFENTGDVTCVAQVLHRGRRISTVEAKAYDKNGKLLAHGTGTCAILGNQPVK
ncbi:MAG: PaaI family thioesterase [Cohaesibacteraceae bacterium]|nr:PaaI family thioesterase [Cohaesibacteraceae bacterium]MBL4875610.1 PaaI family thioesterase [Cohaesibacteraceae bacterium]